MEEKTLKLLENKLDEKETEKESEKGGVITLTRFNELEQERGGLFCIRLQHLPIRTASRMIYEGTNATITENGKSWECKIPEKNGYYEPDEHGFPFGKPSNGSSPTAKYFWRMSKGNTLLVVGDYFFGYDRRSVYASYVDYFRCGVLVER